MANLMQSARVLVSDLASTLLFLVVLLITKDLILAVALGVGWASSQIGWHELRRQPIDTMQWLSIVLVVASGIGHHADQRRAFVMLKPSGDLLHRRRLDAEAGLDEPLSAADRVAAGRRPRLGPSASCGPA